ncbi:MAG: response regulator [bacterium]
MKKSIETAAAGSAQGIKPGRNVASKPRILVAEDDVEMRRLLVTQLRHAGFETVECADGFQLLDHLGNPVVDQESDDYDLIVSDIRMPGITGLEVLEGIHESDWFVPMILITAFGNDEVHRQARSLGAAGMFDKPFEIDDLIDRIREILVLNSSAGNNWSLRFPQETAATEFPLDIIFSDMEVSDFLRDAVHESADLLAPLNDKILYCRVVLVGPDHPDSGGRYHIQIMVTTTRKVFVVRSNLKSIADYQEMRAAIPTAFEVTAGKIHRHFYGKQRN